MPRGHELIGLPVLALPGLRRLGRVAEVLIETAERRICGLVLEEGGFLQPRRVLDYDGVTSVESNHILAHERYLDESAGGCAGRTLLGKPVLDTAGRELGVLDDFQFDGDGRLVALQLSRGFVDDLWNGKALVGVPGTVTAGEAAIMLDGAGDSLGGAQN